MSLGWHRRCRFREIPHQPPAEVCALPRAHARTPTRPPAPGCSGPTTSRPIQPPTLLPGPIKQQLPEGGDRCMGGSVVEFSPATREARVRFPAHAALGPLLVLKPHLPGRPPSLGPRCASRRAAHTCAPLPGHPQLARSALQRRTQRGTWPPHRSDPATLTSAHSTPWREAGFPVVPDPLLFPHPYARHQPSRPFTLRCLPTASTTWVVSRPGKPAGYLARTPTTRRGAASPKSDTTRPPTGSRVPVQRAPRTPKDSQ